MYLRVKCSRALNCLDKNDQRFSDEKTPTSLKNDVAQEKFSEGPESLAVELSSIVVSQQGKRKSAALAKIGCSFCSKTAKCWLKSLKKWIKMVQDEEEKRDACVKLGFH